MSISMRHFRISAILLIGTLLLSACSLTRDIFQMEDADDYEAYIEKWAPTEDAFVAVQRLAAPAIDSKDWAAAIDIFERNKPRFPGMEARFDMIIAILRQPSFDVEMTNLGDGINSPADEIKPSVTVDGTRLYFASDREGGKGKLDIYVAQFENGAWQPPVNLGDRINTPDHETINGLSFDGTKILIYGGFEGHLGSGDNYYFEKTEQGWSAIKHFPPMVNSKFYDSDAFMTADGFAVIFTSDREGVVGDRVPKNTRFHGSIAGNTDLFVAVRRGVYWQPPINLGPVINTPFAERSAFLHPDGKTLYFSSDGHPGLGKMDVFKSIRLNTNSWTEWSEPINLGKDVNGSDDDWGYRITPDGKYAFLSTSNQPDGRGENDIYMITLPKAARPQESVAIIQGKIEDEDGKPVSADLIAQDLTTGDILARASSDPETGDYALTLPEGRDQSNIGIFAEKQGFYPDAFNLRLGDLDRFADASLNNNGGNGGNDGSGNDGSGNGGNDGSGNDGSGNGGNDGSGNGGNDGSGNGGNDGSGNDGSGNDGSGNDGSGNGGSGNDGSGNGGSGNGGSGNGGSGNGGNDGSGNDGSGNDGSGNDGSGNDGSGNDGSGNDGSGNDDSGSRRVGHNFVLKSVDDMMNKRDKWGDLLAQRVNNIFFDFNKWDLKPASFFELDRLVRFLESNPAIRIVVAAHTDDIGTEEYNVSLSNKRANSVVTYLSEHGIAATRLEGKGYGEARPVAPNDTEENRALNRRVEFRIAE
jgi:outer membrane protein OmpA-like peptidoglycan-associated protein/Tol biopolymer transport system component